MILKEERTTLSKCSAMACHQFLISCLNSFLSASSIVVSGVVAGGAFSDSPLFVNWSLGIRRSKMSSTEESMKETRYDLCAKWRMMLNRDAGSDALGDDEEDVCVQSV